MPHDPAPLTEAEREFLTGLLRKRFDRANNRAMIDSLAVRGLVNPCDARVDFIYWAISDAGRLALIEAAVTERFKAVDTATSCYPSHMAIKELGSIARDQERRLMRLEQRGGGT